MRADAVPIRKLQRRRTSFSDEQLARLCAGGDPEAIGELFDRFHPRIARYLTRLSFSPPDIEDLVQQVFVEVVRGKASYDGRASVTTWLFSIATNVGRHHRRASSRRRRWTSLFAAGKREARPLVPEDRLDARMKLDRAQEALAALRRDLREAFVLCELEGLSAREAGAVLGASEAAVWKRVSKARRAIRRRVLEGRGM